MVEFVQCFQLRYLISVKFSETWFQLNILSRLTIYIIWLHFFFFERFLNTDV